MLRHLTNRTSVLVALLRPDQSLYERYSGSVIQNAFFVTSLEDRRLSDLACGLINEHYADARLAHYGEQNAERVKAVRIANHALGWVQAAPRDLTPAEYDAVNETLGSVAPLCGSYQSAMAAFQLRVRALIPTVGAEQPLRTSYHDAQLHYVHPDFVHGAASKALVRTWCDLRAAADMVVNNDFGVEDIPEADWPQIWRGMSLDQKLRWFEFKARVEEVTVRNRQNTYLYAAIAAICKGGNCTAAWCESRMRQMTELHGIVIDKTIMTPPVLRMVFSEFVDKAHVTVDDLYNMLITWYWAADRAGVTVLKWAIEQMGASGATALILISDVVTGAGLRWAHLRQAGVPGEEFAAFAKAALELIRNRLSYVIRPVVDSSRYASITGISKAIASSEGYVTYTDYETNRDKARGMTSKARMMQAFVRSNIRSQARSAMNAESLIRSMYNMRVVTNPDGTVSAMPIEAREEPGNVDRYTAASEDLLPLIPLREEDRAFLSICEAVLVCGQQQPWPLVADGRQPSPYRNLPEDLIEAAATLGHVHVIEQDPYQLPPVMDKDIARPVLT